MFTRLIIIAITLLISACTERYTEVVPASTGANGRQNTAILQGVEIVTATPAECPAGGLVYSVYLDENADGAKGATEKVLSSYPICNGANGSAGANGSDGAQGVPGAPGADGADGHDGVNGSDGQDGEDGEGATVSPFTPVEVIFACGASVPYKEVLLRLQNGQVLGTFSNDTGGTMTRLAFLPDGTFMNTDNSGCTFSLSTSADGHTRSISWNNQVQQSWAYAP